MQDLANTDYLYLKVLSLSTIESVVLIVKHFGFYVLIIVTDILNCRNTEFRMTRIKEVSVQSYCIAILSGVFKSHWIAVLLQLHCASVDFLSLNKDMSINS